MPVSESALLALTRSASSCPKSPEVEALRRAREAVLRFRSASGDVLRALQNQSPHHARDFAEKSARALRSAIPDLQLAIDAGIRGSWVEGVIQLRCEVDLCLLVLADFCAATQQETPLADRLIFSDVQTQAHRWTRALGGALRAAEVAS